MKIPCPQCGLDHELAELLEDCTWWREVDVLQGKCPRGRALEFGVDHGRVSFGYVYASGSPHFCGMVDHAVSDLVVMRGDHTLEVALGERSWSIPRRGAQRDDAAGPG